MSLPALPFELSSVVNDKGISKHWLLIPPPTVVPPTSVIPPPAVVPPTMVVPSPMVILSS